MAVRYLLDTNTASSIIQGNPARLRDRLLRVLMAEVGVSVITEAELRFDVARRREASKLSTAVDEFLLRVEVLPWDSEAAKNYARLRATLEERGEPMRNLDIVIAAHALAAATVLVTSNRVFRRVKGLKVEDWNTRP